MPRVVRWAAVLLAFAGVTAAVLVSRHTTGRSVEEATAAEPSAIVVDSDVPVMEPGPAPSINAAAGWLNTGALTDVDLRGRVVLYDFWTFGCVNCQHTLPHVKAWQERYAADGLVILSIHTPEFDYEAVPDNVADYVEEEGITYPVALDPERKIWNGWGNHYWPAFYLYDRRGRLRLRHYGEGFYDTTEDAIRALLGVDPASARAELSR